MPRDRNWREHHRSTDDIAALQYQCLQSRFCQIGSAHQAVMTAAYDECIIVFHKKKSSEFRHGDIDSIVFQLIREILPALTCETISHRDSRIKISFRGWLKISAAKSVDSYISRVTLVKQVINAHERR